jgi:hypothetical protein
MDILCVCFGERYLYSSFAFKSQLEWLLSQTQIMNFTLIWFWEILCPRDQVLIMHLTCLLHFYKFDAMNHLIIITYNFVHHPYMLTTLLQFDSELSMKRLWNFDITFMNWNQDFQILSCISNWAHFSPPPFFFFLLP